MSDVSPRFVPDQYKIIKQLGSGQTSFVYLAWHPIFGEVALKLPRPELQHRPVLWRMFENEVQITLSLNGGHWRSSNIIQALEGFPTGDKAFLTLEHCPGGTLDMLLSKDKLDFETATRLILEVARGLEFAHKQQVLHRDVKPANVMLTNQLQAKLADFGTGLFMTERTSERVGTAFYMAPEIFEGHPPSVQSDVYSLGVLAYEVLASERPFKGHSYDELMLQHLTSVPVNLKYKRSDISIELSHVIAQAMSRDKAKRFNSVTAFISTFEQVTQEQPEITTGRKARDSAVNSAKNEDEPSKTRGGFFSWFKKSKN
ncbi:MAG: serine/threonine protein kinase [Trueperaceae bacterium]|nr:serine/threonine protein kinase [Trueperaceae bacterium]